MRTRITLGIFCCFVLLAGASAPAEETAADPWNAEKAAAAATRLAEALNGLRDALRKAPGGMGGFAGGSSGVHSLRDRLRLMESESKHLARQLRDGEGRDETYPVFRRIDEIRRSAVDPAERMFLQQPVLEKIQVARPAMEELAGYYGVELKHQLETR